mgnify:FL=1
MDVSAAFIHTQPQQEKKEMTDEMFGESMAVMRMANEPNRLVHGYQVHMDPQFHKENYDQLFHSKSKKDVEI